MPEGSHPKSTRASVLARSRTSMGTEAAEAETEAAEPEEEEAEEAAEEAAATRASSNVKSSRFV